MYITGLELSGLQTEAVGTGAEALDALARLRPSIVVTDLALPDMDGLELCRHLAADPHTRDIPRIVLTGRSTDAVAEQDLLASCRIVLRKPCLPDELAAAISEVLSSN